MIVECIRYVGHGTLNLMAPVREEALVLEIGDRVWWPCALTRLAGRGRREPAPGRIAVETKS
jgi:hypothetical protein